MRNLVQMVAPYVGRKEALAEAMLLHALQSSRNLRSFGELVCPDQRYSFVSAEQQLCTCDGEARHDLVLVSATGIELMVELKFDAPFTPRQRRALGLGGPGRPKAGCRIDVLVIPAVRRDEVAALRRELAIVTWEDIDNTVKMPQSFGRFTDLYGGTSTFSGAAILAEARKMVAYRRGNLKEAYWHNLWRALDYLRRSIGDEVKSGRIGLGDDGVVWYGFAFEDSKKREHWLGWNFSGGKRGQFKACFLLLDCDKLLPKKLVEPLPSWASNETDVGLTLWDSESPDAPAHLDFGSFAGRIRDVLARSRSTKQRAA